MMPESSPRSRAPCPPLTSGRSPSIARTGCCRAAARRFALPPRVLGRPGAAARSRRRGRVAPGAARQRLEGRLRHRHLARGGRQLSRARRSATIRRRRATCRRSTAAATGFSRRSRSLRSFRNRSGAAGSGGATQAVDRSRPGAVEHHRGVHDSSRSRHCGRPCGGRLPNARLSCDSRLRRQQERSSIAARRRWRWLA